MRCHPPLPVSKFLDPPLDVIASEAGSSGCRALTHTHTHTPTVVLSLCLSLMTLAERPQHNGYPSAAPHRRAVIIQPAARAIYGENNRLHDSFVM